MLLFPKFTYTQQSACPNSYFYFRSLPIKLSPLSKLNTFQSTSILLQTGGNLHQGGSYLCSKVTLMWWKRPSYSRIIYFQHLLSSELSRKNRIAPSRWWTPILDQKETLQLVSAFSASLSPASMPFISNPELWLCFQAFGYFGEHLRSK